MNADRVLAAVRVHPGLTDAELAVRTGVRPHQQVNHICRLLEERGLLARRRGPAGRIVNVALPMSQPVAGGSMAGVVDGAVPDERWPTPGALVVLPCSGRKRKGGRPALPGPSVLDLLPPHLAEQLRAARASVAEVALIRPGFLLPAWERYSGGVYWSASDGFRIAPVGGPPAVILSGGYGLVRTDEPIAWYRRDLTPSDWPAGLLEECLVHLASGVGGGRIVGFCARTTASAKLLRRTPWRREGIEAALVAPELNAGQGAQALVPRALGEAAGSYVSGALGPGWRSSDGLTVHLERLG